MARKRLKTDQDVQAHSALSGFLPPVREWFEQRFGVASPPQRLGWPSIAAGQNTLIVAPTGSGKTLASFLAALNWLWQQPDHGQSKGVRLLYLSPLKALNVDIARNLEGPLAEILQQAERTGFPLRPLQVGVRTGDTPAADRQRMVRRPPDILITTPESLHLLLTGRSRQMLTGVSHVIIDEIHAVCGNKRGVFLSLLLERLAAHSNTEFVRIGLSATQRPLEEVARYLGGRKKVSGRGGSAIFEPRPVTIIDAGQRKDLDILVSQPAGRMRPGESVWPAIEERLLELIGQHQSTIVFANNRRVVERLAAALNERHAARGEAGSEDLAEASPSPPVLARPHHGSLSMDVRRSTEEALKEGVLPAVVATASLELGIDMGAVELVCQVESPGSVARALQRVGRAGHVIGKVSRGRLFAKTAGDLLESAALARAMLSGDVEELRIPRNCLDVLAQQIVASVAVDEWDAVELYDLVRQTAQYADLPAEAFSHVLEMVSGRFGLETFRDLSPRLSWDQIHNKLRPLPGTAHRALSGGGTIPDTGQYPCYLGEGGPRLGELDEEFVLERRAGETFRLGQGTWRIDVIEPHRVLVSPAEGRDALMPFWRGEGAGRSLELGQAVGALTRLVAAQSEDPTADPAAWLMRECHLELESARLLAGYIRRQKVASKAVPDDRTVLVETFTDPAGETGLVILSPLGNKHNHALKLVMVESLRRRLGIEVAALHSDDGILFRLPGMDEPLTDLFKDLGPEEAESLLRETVGQSALFGLRFRQNAGRALLLPRPDPSKRTPLWLQRLRARDLLQAVRRFPDFPIVVESYRECLDDDLDLPRLKAFFAAIHDGSIQVVQRQAETPSAFASELIFLFTQTYLYQWDEPRRGDQPAAASVDDRFLDGLLATPDPASGLDPDAVRRIDAQLRGVGRPPRTTEEMAEWLRRLGDLTELELAGPMASFLEELEIQGRATRISMPPKLQPDRWIGTEDLPLFKRAFPTEREPGREPSKDQLDARTQWVGRYVSTRALVGLEEILNRYALERVDAALLLDELVQAGGLVKITDEQGTQVQWADRQNLAAARRVTLALRRKESLAVTPEVFAGFVARTQYLHPASRLQGEAGLDLVLERLEGHAVSAGLWETEILPRRISGYRPAWLDSLLASGTWTGWAADAARGEPRVAFLSREFQGAWPDVEIEGSRVSESVQGRLVLEYLKGRGPCFVEGICQATGLSPSSVRALLQQLLAEGRVFPDRFDPLRSGGDPTLSALQAAQAARSNPGAQRPRLGSFRRRASQLPEARWLLLEPKPLANDPDQREAMTLAWASQLLDRYGVLTRETVTFDSCAPAWREFIEPLARAELRDELRRGFFVEGLSGLQYALPETVDALARSAGSARDTALLLIHSLDPANLYGSGAPFDIPLLEGGKARFVRQPGNYLIQMTGRPILIIEAWGKRLTGLLSATEEELQQAVGLIPTLAGPARRVLKVETYNTTPIHESPAVTWLAGAGFVRDLGGMAFYASWT